MSQVSISRLFLRQHAGSYFQPRRTTRVVRQHLNHFVLPSGLALGVKNDFYLPGLSWLHRRLWPLNRCAAAASKHMINDQWLFSFILEFESVRFYFSLYNISKIERKLLKNHFRRGIHALLFFLSQKTGTEAKPYYAK